MEILENVKWKLASYIYFTKIEIEFVPYVTFQFPTTIKDFQDFSL